MNHFTNKLTFRETLLILLRVLVAFCVRATVEKLVRAKFFNTGGTHAITD